MRGWRRQRRRWCRARWILVSLRGRSRRGGGEGLKGCRAGGAGSGGGGVAPTTELSDPGGVRAWEGCAATTVTRVTGDGCGGGRVARGYVCRRVALRGERVRFYLFFWIF